MATVVQFTSPPNLRLREVVDAGGNGVITKWLRSKHDARARLRIRVQNLRRIPRVEWPTTQFRHLGSHVYEIKWKASNKEFRALGFDRKGYFVLVIGCTHKQNVYDPAECLSTARRLKGEVENDERTTIDFEP